MSQKKIMDLTEVQSVDENSCYVPVDNGSATVRINLHNLEASATESAESYAQAAAASATSASGYADAAALSSASASTYATNASESAQDAALSAGSASDSADAAAVSASSAAQSASNVSAIVTDVSQQAAVALASAKEAKSFAVGGTDTRAGEDTDNAKYYSIQAGTSASNAATSAANAASSETNAATSESNAATSETNAATSETNAASSESNAATSETNAGASASAAALSEAAAALSRAAAATSSEDAEAWSVGTRNGVPVPATDPAYNNNAKYWAEAAAGAAGGGVTSFNGRSGIVSSQEHDYSAIQVDFDNTDTDFTSTDVQNIILEVARIIYDLDQALATVAKTGSYNDLSNTPNLATVATSGSYADLNNTPTLGTAAAKNSTSTISSGSTDLIESGSVYSLKQTLESEIGDLTDLDTTVKTDLVSAVNEVKALESEIGDLTDLDTTVKTDLVSAVNEVKASGGGAGSFFVILTDENALKGKTVSISDGTLVWQGTFDNTGRAEINGVTSIGPLTIISTDGVDTAETIYTVKNYSRYEIKLNFYTVYGFRVDSTKSIGNVSYKVQYNGDNVGNYDFASAYMNFSTDTWIWGDWTGDEFFMPRPVLIKQDYSEKIYLNPDNLALDEDGNDVSAILTGSTDGYNAMMEWGRNGKKIWYKLVPETDDATYTCYIADKQLDSGFHAWSFYDANNVLGDHFYTSIYNGSTVGSALRSLSGKTPNNNEAGATQITRAKANNQNGETYAWYIDVFADRILINLLMILVIKSTNSDVIGYGNYSGGSSASSLIQSGLGNTKGMFYGKQSNSVCKVFGMENYFANCWRRMAGLILSSGAQLYKLTYGTADGSSAAGYIESDSAPANYLNASKNIATNLSTSYITKESALSNGALIASAFAGANATYYSDACWSSTGVRFSLVGGSCAYGSACGAFALDLSDALSISDWNGGAALSLKPLAQ